MNIKGITTFFLIKQILKNFLQKERRQRAKLKYSQFLKQFHEDKCRLTNFGHKSDKKRLIPLR